MILAGAVEAEGDLYSAGAAGVLAIGRRPRVLAAALATTGEDLRAAALAITTLVDRAMTPTRVTVPR